MHAAVVTSIQSPTSSLRVLAGAATWAGMRLLVVGDRSLRRDFEQEAPGYLGQSA